LLSKSGDFRLRYGHGATFNVALQYQQISLDSGDLAQETSGSVPLFKDVLPNIMLRRSNFSDLRCLVKSAFTQQITKHPAAPSAARVWAPEEGLSALETVITTGFANGR
jgi:hypothetical protein